MLQNVARCGNVSVLDVFIVHDAAVISIEYWTIRAIAAFSMSRDCFWC